MAKKKFARECTACKGGMNEGYCIEGGIEYYCSDACLHTEITHEEYMELYADGEGDSYWTDWSEDPDNFEDEDEDEDEDEGKDDLTEALQETVAKQSLVIRDLMGEADRLREVVDAQDKIIALLKKQQEA